MGQKGGKFYLKSIKKEIASQPWRLSLKFASGLALEINLGLVIFFLFGEKTVGWGSFETKIFFPIFYDHLLKINSLTRTCRSCPKEHLEPQPMKNVEN
jgi:hypothetical protein